MYPDHHRQPGLGIQSGCPQVQIQAVFADAIGPANGFGTVTKIFRNTGIPIGDVWALHASRGEFDGRLRARTRRVGQRRPPAQVTCWRFGERYAPEYGSLAFFTTPNTMQFLPVRPHDRL